MLHTAARHCYEMATPRGDGLITQTASHSKRSSFLIGWPGRLRGAFRAGSSTGRAPDSKPGMWRFEAVASYWRAAAAKAGSEYSFREFLNRWPAKEIMKHHLEQLIALLIAAVCSTLIGSVTLWADALGGWPLVWSAGVGVAILFVGAWVAVIVSEVL